MSLVIRVGRRHALYLPREVVEKLGIHEGGKLLLGIRGDELAIRPLPRPTKGRGATGPRPPWRILSGRARSRHA